MKFRYIFALVVLLVCFGGRAFTQASLGIGHNGVQVFPDTVNCAIGDSTVSYFFYVVNPGPSEYRGGITINAIFNGDTSHAPYTMGYHNNDTIPGGDSTFFSISDSVRSPYGGGDNIIVIWPASTDIVRYPTIDSATVHVYTENCPVGRAADLVFDRRISIWPNPVHDHLNLKFGEDRELFDHVRIYDLNGKEILHNSQVTDRLDVMNFSPGIYILEAAYSDGLRGFFRLVKE